MARLSLFPIIAVCAGVVHFLSVLPGEAQSLTEFRKKYLKANSLKEVEIRIDPNNVQSIFYQIVKEMVYEEPEIAADLVLQTNVLIQREIESRGVFKPITNGASYMAGCFEYYEDMIASLECVGLMVRTYRKDLAGNIPYTGEGNDSQQFALLGHFLSLGGNYDALRAMERMQADLRIACGEGQSIFLAPYFFDFAYHLRPTQRNQIAKWAIEKSRDPDLTISGFGEAIHLGFAMFERAERNPVLSHELWRGNALDARLLEVLQNSGLSPTWRVGFTALMARHFRDEMSPTLRQEIGRLLTLALNDKLPFAGSSFAYSIAAFLRGNNEDQAWRSQGIDLVTAWENRTSPAVNATTRRLNPGGDWTVPMMELICRVGTEKQAIAHYSDYCLEDLVYPGLWINLIKGGRYDLANLAHQKQALLSEYSPDHYGIDTAYDAVLARAIPAYLATIKNQGDRSFAELLLIATPDPEIPKPGQPDSTLQSRLRDFAIKHKTLPDWGKDQQIRAFEVLSLSQGGKEIREWIESNQIGLESRIEQEEPRIRPYWAARIEMHSAAEELENGLSFPIELWWGRAVVDDNQIIARRRGDLCRAILTMMDERIISGCATADIDRLENFLPMSRSILESVPDYVYRPYVLKFMIRSLAAHALCSKMDRWEKWWQTLDPVRRRLLVSLLTYSDELTSSLGPLLNPGHQDPEKAFPSPQFRKDLFKGIFSTGWVNEGGVGYSNLANASAGKLLTERDIYDIAEGIARKAPRGGSSWREFLGILSDQEQLEEALRFVDEELRAMDPTLPLGNALKIEKLLILGALNRDDEAEKFLSKFETTDLDLPREYQAIEKNLKKR